MTFIMRACRSFTFSAIRVVIRCHQLSSTKHWGFFLQLCSFSSNPASLNIYIEYKLNKQEETIQPFLLCQSEVSLFPYVLSILGLPNLYLFLMRTMKYSGIPTFPTFQSFNMIDALLLGFLNYQVCINSNVSCSLAFSQTGFEHFARWTFAHYYLWEFLNYCWSAFHINNFLKTPTLPIDIKSAGTSALGNIISCSLY